MEQDVTARLDAIGSDGPEAALSRAAPGDDPLTIFQPEPQRVGKGSGDSAALRMDAIPSQAPSVPFATPSVNDGKPRTAGVVNHIKRVLRTLDIARDFEKTVDNRRAALRDLDQEVQDRARRLECLKQEIIVGAAHADDILRAIETTVAAFENRAQTVSTSLGRHVAGWEAREAAVVGAVEQLGRRAADTIDDLEGRVGDCEARAHIAEQTITRLYDVSSRTLPVLQERTKEAEEQNQSLRWLVTEALRMATSLTALKERLPAVGQCDQDLARIELAVPQIARQLEDLNSSAEQQSRVLAVRQEAERYQREETHRASAVLAGLETRMAEIGRTHRELDVAERHVEQLEQRAAAAAGEVRHATSAKDELQREIAKCQQQIERLTTAAQGEAEKLNGLRRHAEYHGADRASSPSAHDLLNTLRFRRRGPNTSRGSSPARLIFGGAAFTLSAAIVLLVSIVWRISPVENQRPEKPLPAVVLANRALTLAPALAVAPPMPLTADISHDRREATRPAPAVPAVPVPLVVVSETPVATRGVPTAAVREQSVRKGAKTPQFVGTLLIESDPAGAAVFVNQESVGDTPVLLKDLRAGSYVVRLEYEGYQRWSSAATVSAVRQERVKAKLERERSR
jgi:PEGA domain